MPDTEGRPLVYLAGPDVFYADVHSRAAKMRETLAEIGMTGLFPLDGDLTPERFPDKQTLAIAIARANEALMRRADMVIANIQPWRGPEADDGTAYEIGFMAALGKPIVLYTSDRRPFFRRIVDDCYGGDVYNDGALIRGRRDDFMVEDFGLADNLMLINAAVAAAERAGWPDVDAGAIVKTSFKAAADFARQLWDKGRLQSQSR
jgi:nucleoside 2-deoxyribosyltransferase